MEALFETVWNMTKTASAVIIVVLIARAILKKAPKKFSYALWSIVLFRLLCPLAIETPFSPLPAAQVALTSPAAWLEERPSGTVQTEDISLAQSTGLSVSTPGYIFEPAPLSAPLSAEQFIARNGRVIIAAVWITGAAGLLLYSALSLLRLRRRLVGAVPLAGEDRVFLADHIPTPFVMGVLRPNIYLPSDLPECERDYILLHERTHIRRLDYVTRSLAWLAVSLHWFNPLVWLSFRLAGQDMEMSCDENVLRSMGRDVRSDYSASLLRLSVKGLPAGPLTFGGGSLKDRISNVLNYKKPAVWVGTAALAAVVCVSTALATGQEGLYIASGSITSFAEFNASSYTITDANTIVYTQEDREKDLQDPVNFQSVPREDGVDLIHLINFYGKRVWNRGEFQLNGPEHHFVRLDRKDGGFYLVDHWYWNGFSFNPLHFGEDSYTTLVTYFDAEGNAGTTWQMEYGFDLAYREWRNPSPPVQRGELKRSKVTMDGVEADLTFSMYTLEHEVDIEGTIGGVKLQPEASYWSSEPFPWYPDLGFEYPCGWLSLVQWEFMHSQQVNSGRIDGSSTRQFGIYAGWTDETRTSVSISTQPRIINNYSSFHGYWHFTVELSTGTVTAMEPQLPYYDPNFTSSDPVVMHPESISEEEAVEMARTAAKLIEAAEIYFTANYQP